MLTESQNKTLKDFNEAKKIALSISAGEMKRPDSQNIFLGANLANIGTCVLWYESDKTEVVHDCKLEISGKVFFCRKVDFFTMLSA